MAGNKSLGSAKDAKYDEFYTQLDDIENELRHYKEHFKGKTVLCNCDDPYESNFFKYFAMNFNHLGLKKLITTCYVSSPFMYTQLSLFDDMEFSFGKPADPNKKPYKVEITEVSDENDDGAFDLEDIKQLLKSKKNICTILKGDGDFRSDECVKFLKEADIIVTNPPFSLFREFVNLVLSNNKKLLIIGNKNALHYKEIFPLIRNSQLWIGYTTPNTFNTPEGLTNKVQGLCRWFTNLDIEKRHEELILYKHYTPEEYPTYDNFDGIDVSSKDDIPCDYFGNMGVPDSFLEEYNPDQFEILGIGSGNLAKEAGVKKNYRGRTDIAYTINGVSKCPYSRILIRRKEQPQ